MNTIRCAIFLALVACAACSDSNVTAPSAPVVSADVAGVYAVSTMNQAPLPQTSTLYNSPDFTNTVFREVLTLNPDSSAVLTRETQNRFAGVLGPITSGKATGSYRIARDTVYVDLNSIPNNDFHNTANGDLLGTYRLTKHANMLYSAHSEMVFTYCDSVCYIPSAP